MVSKILKLAAVPASLAFTSYGLYAVSDREPRGARLPPNKLSVYSAPPRESHFIEDRPGRVQSAFTALRLGLSPVVTGGKSLFIAVRNGVEGTLQFGIDSYEFLKDPPPEFLPRAGIITVSGLAGLVLARRGSRLKKVLYPVGLAAVGASVCYPAQAVIFAKVSGKKLYSAGCWSYDAVSSLWKVKPQKEATPTSKDKEPDMAPIEAVAEDTTTQEQIRTENNAEAESVAVTEAVADEATQEPIKTEPSESVTDVVPTEAVAETTTREPIRTEETEPASPEPEHTADPHTGSASPDPAPGSRFSPPPRLSDHGQSNPEDVDMYSTRS